MDALKGAIIALVSGLLVALLFAYLFRLPIPMGGYIGPFGEISTFSTPPVDVFKAVFVAWLFYGMFGGFITLLACGAITGAYVGRKYAKAKNKNKIIVWSCVAVSTIPVFILSILDHIIGPW